MTQDGSRNISFYLPLPACSIPAYSPHVSRLPHLLNRLLQKGGGRGVKVTLLLPGLHWLSFTPGTPPNSGLQSLQWLRSWLSLIFFNQPCSSNTPKAHPLTLPVTKMTLTERSPSLTTPAQSSLPPSPLHVYYSTCLSFTGSCPMRWRAPEHSHHLLLHLYSIQQELSIHTCQISK